MCGRYLLKAPADALRRAFGFIEQPNLMPRYNIAPTQDVPVILAPEDYARWLDRDSSEAELKALLKPAPQELLAYFPVSPRVNAAAPDDAGLIEPVGAEVAAA